MDKLIAFGAALCVPIIVVLTLEVEMRVDRWARQLVRNTKRLVQGR